MKVEKAVKGAFRARVRAIAEDGDADGEFFANLRANGYEIVPREATEKMLRAMCELDCADRICQHHGKCQGDRIILRRYAEAWEYALAAAQEDSHE